MIRDIAIVLLLILSVITVPVVMAADESAKKSSGNADNKAVSLGAGQSESKLNPIAQAAANAGVSKCVGRVDQLSRFLADNTQSGAFMFLPPNNADKHFVSASIEMIKTDNVISYASASAAPAGENGCGGLYEEVVYWQNKCSAVAEGGFPGTKQAGALLRHIRVLEGEASMRIFLMPAGEGCVSIKKEVIY